MARIQEWKLLRSGILITFAAINSVEEHEKDDLRAKISAHCNAAALDY
jgi:hypothetical protein